MNRGAFAAAGGAALAFAWSPAPAAIFGHGFAAHMTSHMIVVAAAAPLLAIGLVGSRADPSVSSPSLFAAVPASLVELLAVWGWHAPGAHDLARANGPAYAAEQASFLIAGLWLWIACLGHGRSRPAAAQGAVAMLLTSIHMTLLGVLLSTTTAPLYAAHHGGGAAALDQQHMGGIVMLLIGGGVYLAGGLALAARLLRDDGEGTPAFTSLRRGEVDVAPATAGEEASGSQEKSRPPHAALRADLSPPGKGEGRRLAPDAERIAP